MPWTPAQWRQIQFYSLSHSVPSHFLLSTLSHQVMKNCFYFFFWIWLKSTTKRLKESAFWRTPSDHQYPSDVWGYFYWVSSSLRGQDALEHVVWIHPCFREQKPLVLPLHWAEKLANSFDCSCLSIWQRSRSVTSLSEVPHPFISLQEKKRREDT